MERKFSHDRKTSPGFMDLRRGGNTVDYPKFLSVCQACSMSLKVRFWMEGCVEWDYDLDKDCQYIEDRRSTDHKFLKIGKCPLCSRIESEISILRTATSEMDREFENKQTRPSHVKSHKALVRKGTMSVGIEWTRLMEEFNGTGVVWESMSWTRKWSLTGDFWYALMW